MGLTSQSSLAEARDELIGHPLYAEIRSLDDVRIFMRSHVFAVWDFFSLLKRLQSEVTCVTVPWTPKQHAEHGRFVMDIVLGEETDMDVGGGYISHFELYRRAMDELGADTGPIDAFLARVADGVAPIDALDGPEISQAVRAFTGHTLAIAVDGQPHEVAASFCHGRENLLPDVLDALRDGVGSVLDDAPVFKHYVDRHIELDHDEHGPLALKLLASLCDGDAALEAQAEEVGIAAVRARTALWDGILVELRAARPIAKA